jgi:hypothetical protein
MSRDDWPEFNFDPPPDEPSRADQIFSAFASFHSANPAVWILFERFALQLIAAGRENYSSNGIFERIRWHIDTEITSLGEIRLNNNFRAYYARLFHVAHPQHDGFFRNRKRTSEDRPGSDNDEQEFVGPPPGPEPDLEARLKKLLL